MLFEEGNPLRDCVNEALTTLEGRRDAGGDPAAVALREDERTRARLADRSSRILGGRGGGRSLAIATASTIVVFGALALAVVNSPGWDEVREAFFYGPEFRESFPDILEKFATNVKLFLLAEVFILVWGLALAVLRSLPGPGLLPAPAPLGRLHRHLPRDPDDPARLPARLRRARAAARGVPTSAVLLGSRLARARLLGVRRRGLPGRDRLRAPEPGGGGALARASTASRRSATSSSRRRSGASSRRS